VGGCGGAVGGGEEGLAAEGARVGKVEGEGHGESGDDDLRRGGG
jgi:hypothetical protein